MLLIPAVYDGKEKQRRRGQREGRDDGGGIEEATQWTRPAAASLRQLAQSRGIEIN
jgi:hypothetical protein